MDAQGRLTIEDGERYLAFVEKWGETPQGRKMLSCSNCGRCIGHSDSCDRTLRGRYASYEAKVWAEFQKFLR